VNFKKTVQALQTEWHGEGDSNPHSPTGLSDNGSANAGSDSPGKER
jgi:hypothetical protein